MSSNTAGAGTKYSQLVMIIRHGEKPGDPCEDSEGGPNLSTLGSARAAALPSLFTPDPTAQPADNGQQQLSCDVVAASRSDQFTGTYASSGLAAGSPRFPTPNFLFATHQSKSSSRPIETLTPLSQALSSLKDPKIDSKIHHHFTDNAYADLAQEILNTPQTYGGQVILICWHHGKAPKLAHKLGVSKSLLTPWEPWNCKVFDLVFKITWDSSGQANLEVDYQQLLFNDTPQPVKG
jgi:hypothetical protein